MKKMVVFIGLIATMLVGLILLLLCVVRVPNGYVGVQYSVNGGVQDEILTQGWHIVSPAIKVTKYSVATEQLYLSADSKEGSEGDDSFDVVCKDGLMNIDIEMSYSFNSDDVSTVFQKYRGISGEEIVNTIVRGKIKTKVSEVTSNYTVLDAYMEEKAKLNTDITKELREYLADFGITVESCNITRASVDAAIANAITERSLVAQELEVELMNQEKAKLSAETALIAADGANAVLIANATAQAEAYKIETAEITDDLLAKWEIEKWDGAKPVTFYGSGEGVIVDASQLVG